MDTRDIPAGTVSFSPFIQKHSTILRIWHWTTYLTLTASIITVLFASTLLQPRQNIGLVQEQLQRKGAAVTEEQAFAVAHKYEDKMWNIHKFIGFGLTFLLVLRIIIEIVQPGDEKLSRRLKEVIKLRQQNTGNKLVLRHYLIAKWGYLTFYGLLLMMVLTGLGLSFEHEVAILGQLHKALKSIHSLLQYLMYAYVLLHLCGVIIADNGSDRGIVSGMINGNRSRGGRF